MKARGRGEPGGISRVPPRTIGGLGRKILAPIVAVKCRDRFPNSRDGILCIHTRHAPNNENDQVDLGVKFPE